LLPEDDRISAGVDERSKVTETEDSTSRDEPLAVLQLLDLLPPSLERLDLNSDGIQGDVNQLAEELLRLVPRYLPALKQLHVQGVGSSFADKVTAAGLTFKSLA
jgi:hypothetical protein